MAVPPQDGEVHDTRHRFDRQLAGTSASAAALACDCDCPFIVHSESPDVQALGRSIGPRPANLLGLNAFDRLSGLLLLHTNDTNASADVSFCSVGRQLSWFVFCISNAVTGNQIHSPADRPISGSAGQRGRLLTEISPRR